MKDKTINKRIGEQLRMIRLSKNLSLEALSDELKISVSTLSNLERGETEMTVSRLYDLLAHFDYDILTFFQNLNESSINHLIASDQNRTVYASSTDILKRLEDEINQLKSEMKKLKNK